MGRKYINFDNKKIKKFGFYKNKKLLQINDIDFNKTLVSKKEPYDKKNAFKHIIGYNDNGVIRPSYLNISKFIIKYRENILHSH